MKWTRQKATRRAEELSNMIDKINAEIKQQAIQPNWFEFAQSEEGVKLFNARAKATRLWVEAQMHATSRSQLVKKLRWC